MRRFATFLTLTTLTFTAAACGGDEPPATTDPGASGATQSDGGAAQVGGAAPARRPIEVEITADGFNQDSAKVTLGQGIDFNNNDSKPHTITPPDGHEQVVETGETFKYRYEGCCAATFTDEETGGKFKMTVE